MMLGTENHIFLTDQEIIDEIAKCDGNLENANKFS